MFRNLSPILFEKGGNEKSLLKILHSILKKSSYFFVIFASISHTLLYREKLTIKKTSLQRRTTFAGTLGEHAEGWLSEATNIFQQKGADLHADGKSRRPKLPGAPPRSGHSRRPNESQQSKRHPK